MLTAFPDQGVMGGILTLEVFLNQFPIINPAAVTGAESATRATNQGALTTDVPLSSIYRG